MNRLYTQSPFLTDLCEPTVFDRVIRQAASGLLVLGDCSAGDQNKNHSRSYFTKSFASVVSILIPGPMVVETAIPFR